MDGLGSSSNEIMNTQSVIDFEQLENLLEQSISLFPKEGNHPVELKAHLVGLRLKELKEICREMKGGSDVIRSSNSPAKFVSADNNQ